MYTIWYKKVNRLFWKKIKNVKEDRILSDLKMLFIRDSKDTWYKIPLEEIMFKFSPERAAIIAMKIEQENAAKKMAEERLKSEKNKKEQLQSESGNNIT